MYVSRVQYEGCSSFQDTNAQGSSQPDSLFNLTQNYYYVVSSEDYFVQQGVNCEQSPPKE